MPVLVGILLAYVAAGLAYWLWTAYAAIRMRLEVPSLSDLESPEPTPWPKLSVVIPACNEGDTIEPAARTLLALDYPDLELILVDDRSTDSTGAVIDRLAAGDRRIKAIHIKELPEGWLGKVNALNRGFAESTGRWVLFTDADIHFQPDALRLAVAHAEAERLDHLAALPQLWPTNLALDATVAAFVRQFLAVTRPWAVSRASSRAFLGIGAFNLVRRSAFEATDGFEWLRMETADDMGVGLLMKRSGGKCGVVLAVGYVGLHWYRTFGEAARGTEKAFSTAFHCSVVRAVLSAVIVMGLELSPVLSLVPLAFDEVRPVGYAGVAVLAAYLCSVALLHRWAEGASLLPALLSPLTAPLLAAAAIRAGLLGWRRGGTVWRGTLYPSKALREGSRMRFL